MKPKGLEGYYTIAQGPRPPESEATKLQEIVDFKAAHKRFTEAPPEYVWVDVGNFKLEGYGITIPGELSFRVGDYFLLNHRYWRICQLDVTRVYLERLSEDEHRSLVR